MTDIALLYVSAPDRAVAETIGRALVEEELAACINILGDIGSIYRWEGKIETSAEVAFFVKTTKAQAQSAISRIAVLHPYACPAILQLPIESGFEPFLAWIDAQTNA